MKFDPMREQEVLEMRFGEVEVPEMKLALGEKSLFIEVSGANTLATCAVDFAHTLSKAAALVFSKSSMLFVSKRIGTVSEGFIFDPASALIVKFEIAYTMEGFFKINYGAEVIRTKFSTSLKIYRMENAIAIIDEEKDNLLIIKWVNNLPAVHMYKTKGKVEGKFIDDGSFLAVFESARTVFLIDAPDAKKVKFEEDIGKRWHVNFVEEGALIETEKGIFQLFVTTFEGEAKVKKLMRKSAEKSHRIKEKPKERIKTLA